MKSMKKVYSGSRFIIFLCCIIAASTAVSACTGKNPDGTHNGKPAQKKKLSHSILFVLGKDFYQYEDMLGYIDKIYDPETLENNIRILTYSDMTAKTKQPRLAMITDRLAAKPADILISVGIPEGGAKILRTVKETYPGLHIFSLLPVEEILPLEAYSDIVVDFELPDSFTNADRAVDIPTHDIQTLMLTTVIAAEQTGEMPRQEPFPRFARAITTAAALLDKHGVPAWGGTPYILRQYKDPELNIRSYNYLILSQESDNGTVQQEKHNE